MITTETKIVQESHFNLGVEPGRKVTLLPDPEPREVKNLLISVDDHIIEPPDLFDGRLPADQAPHVEVADDGAPRWVVDGKRLPILFTNGAAGRVLEEWKGASLAAYHEFRPSVSNPVARLADMDVGGIWASLCFGSTAAQVPSPP